MNFANFNNLVALVAAILAVFTALTSAIFWYVNVEKRRYGLERDFAHLKRSYEHMQQSLNMIITESDHRFDALDRILIEIKSLLLK